jgi:hypothetical protein
MGFSVAFVHHFFSLPVNAAGFAFFVFSNWVCDAILVCLACSKFEEPAQQLMRDSLALEIYRAV